MATVGLQTPKLASSQENGLTIKESAIPGSFVASPTTHVTPFGATPVATSPQVQGNILRTIGMTTPAKSLPSCAVHPDSAPISRKTPKQFYKELDGNIANETLGLLFEVEFQEQAIQTLEAVENKNQRNFNSMQRNFAMLSKGHLALQNQRSDRSRAILDCLDHKNAALQKLLQSEDAKKLMPYILEQCRLSSTSATPQPRARNASPLNLEARSNQDLLSSAAVFTAVNRQFQSFVTMTPSTTALQVANGFDYHGTSDRIEEAYKAWCRVYNKATDSTRLEIFAYHFLLAEKFFGQTGAPIKLNELQLGGRDLSSGQ